MSQTHVDQMREILYMETATDTLTLEGYAINTAEVLAIPSTFDLLPEKTYDPVSDVVHDHVGVHYEPTTPRTCEVVGDNGYFTFCFKLSES